MSKSKVLVSVRLDEEKRAKLKVLADFTGLTVTACMGMLIDRAYHENQKGIDAMMKGRKALRLAEDAEPLLTDDGQ